MSGSTAYGSDEYYKASRVVIRDKTLNPHPELAYHHPEPAILPAAEVLRREPEKDKQTAAPLVRCGVLKGDPSVVVYMRVQESSTAEVNATAQFVLADATEQPTKDDIRFDKHLAFNEKWTGKVGQWRSCADTIDQELDAWKQYLVKVIVKNVPESEKISRGRQTVGRESSPAEDEEPTSEDIGIDEKLIKLIMSNAPESDEIARSRPAFGKETSPAVAEEPTSEDTKSEEEGGAETGGEEDDDIEEFEKRFYDLDNFDDEDDEEDKDEGDEGDEEDEEWAEERKMPLGSGHTSLTSTRT
ncbi:hypothetical protein KC316_g3515 [Hortaea werneckii]|nr:hypothetical protein KC324_g3542 [Hortaea werneckii]KAI7590203.1 hypothetical protein KC316_g3515 [Hortaea werneckii]